MKPRIHVPAPFPLYLLWVVLKLYRRVIPYVRMDLLIACILITAFTVASYVAKNSLP